jgi:adenylate cyclase
MAAKAKPSSVQQPRSVAELEAELALRIAELETRTGELEKRTAERDEALAERDEAVAQQTATAEVLQIINSSPGELAPVFEAILEKAISLCAASFGVLWTYDGEYMHASAITGVPPQFAAFLKQGPHPPARTMQQELLNGRPFGQIPDLTKTEGYQSGETLPRAGADLGGVRTLLGITLRKDETVLGVFGIYRQEVRPFTEKQIALLQNFAAQTVIAMENARLLGELSQRTDNLEEALEQQTATAEVLGVINSSPGDLTPVFDAMLDKALGLCGAAFGVLWTYNGTHLYAEAHRGASAGYAEVLSSGPYPADATGLTRRFLAGEHFVHGDVAAGEGYRLGRTLSRALVDLSGGRTNLAVPLRREDALLGIIVIYRREVRPFADKQIALLQNFAAQAVIAMENARLLGELRQRTDEIAELNRGLEARVAEQVDELGRVGRLKRFLAPQLAELIVSQGDEKILESHRREIVVVFCDLRGYTAFTETAEPEEVLEFLRQYHGALGPLVSQYEGTLDQFSGDGIMVFFNDPVPIPDPAERAVKMAMAMRVAANTLISGWRRHGCELGFGAGIAQGFATLGQIGFSDRSGYTAIGTVCNLAARLCDEAKDGQILISSRIAEAVEAVATLEDLGSLDLKGLRRPVAAFNVGELISGASESA